LPESQIEKNFLFIPTFFHNFYLSQSSLTCPGLRASGLARTDLATSKNGTDIKRINATIFSGFAAKEDGNASIRVELDNNLECKRFCLLSVII
jgi:hypothetical protein